MFQGDLKQVGRKEEELRKDLLCVKRELLLSKMNMQILKPNSLEYRKNKDVLIKGKEERQKLEDRICRTRLKGIPVKPRISKTIDISSPCIV